MLYFNSVQTLISFVTNLVFQFPKYLVDQNAVSTTLINYWFPIQQIENRYYSDFQKNGYEHITNLHTFHGNMTALFYFIEQFGGIVIL